MLGCSDSRAPAEIVFDQGLGDLFVIRVAGNIVAPSQVGSVEFAAERFGTRLVVVMGHTGCGAIDAGDRGDHRRAQRHGASRNLMSIVNRVRPGIQSLMSHRAGARSGAPAPRGDARQRARSVNHLRHGSEVIERLAEEDGLPSSAPSWIGTGEVTFFDDVIER